MLRAVYWSDLFVLGGGGFLSDFQSWTVVWLWLRLVLFAKILRKKVMLYAIGAGPITTWRGKALTRVILNNCTDVITVRDRYSRDSLLKAGVKKKIHVTADPAILLEPEKPDIVKRMLKEAGADISKPLIGVAPRVLFHIEEFWPNQQDRYQELVAFVASLMDFISLELKYDVILVMMHKDDDLPFIRSALKKASKNVKVHMLDGDYSPQETKGIIGCMNLLVGMRYHSLIFAATMGVPMVGIAYHAKTACFLEEIGLSEFAIDVGDGVLWKNSALDIEETKKKIETAWSKRLEVVTRIESKKKKLEDLALVNVKLAQRLLKD